MGEKTQEFREYVATALKHDLKKLRGYADDLAHRMARLVEDIDDGRVINSNGEVQSAGFTIDTLAAKVSVWRDIEDWFERKR
jgi:hypothetical protein